jgi:uncharacterized protein (DUF58 family)
MLQDSLGRFEHGRRPQELGLSTEGAAQGDKQGSLILRQWLEPASGMQPFFQGADALGRVPLEQVQLAQEQAESGLLRMRRVMRQPFGG